jgi:mono/diheme cytochrome c family protein
MNKIWLVGCVSLFLLSCTDHSKPNVELIQDFMESPAIKAQEYDAGSPHNSGMRVPPAGTVPVGFQPYKYPADIEAASKDLKNPLAGDMSEEVLLVGQKFYNTNCMVCHGQTGAQGAEMSVSGFMALKPPSLLTEKVRNWTDGRIYHVITMGQGLMGPYASHIPQKYRWQVVNYIRHLQKTSQ